jgi:hypothetical protein
MDDLVERLRHNPWASPTTDEAADRIEELEAEIKQLKQGVSPSGAVYLRCPGIGAATIYAVDQRSGVKRREDKHINMPNYEFDRHQSQRRKEIEDD